MNRKGYGVPVRRFRQPSSETRRIRISDSDHRMDLDALWQAIESDLALGLWPLLIIGTAGSVGIGAVDDLNALTQRSLSRTGHGMVPCRWNIRCSRHPKKKQRLCRASSVGIQRANSISLDFHKWGQVQYDAGFVLVRDATAGFVLVRDATAHRHTFATEAYYLSRSATEATAAKW